VLAVTPVGDEPVAVELSVQVRRLVIGRPGARPTLTLIPAADPFLGHGSRVLCDMPSNPILPGGFWIT
jgi:hypothetical protein